ncbi:MAG: 3-keto-5-aminohexanoate cleavage protein [Candidatus Dormiibacterota bacterium]
MSRVKACLNGRRRPGEHPGIPITPDQLAAAARDVVAVGAFAVHFHPRTATGQETLSAGPVAAAVRAVREACPGLPIGLSTGAWMEPEASRRLRLIDAWPVVPNFVSVNVGEPGAALLVRRLPDMGIGVEAGINSALAASYLVEDELAGHCIRLLVGVEHEGDGAIAVAEAAAIDSVLDAAGITTPRLHHGTGQSTWDVLAAAVRRGHDVRVGLEDTLTMPDGTPAVDNAALVQAAVALVD